MKPICLSTGPTGDAVSCAVAAVGTIQTCGADLVGLRQKPGPARSLPPAVLRHADEQTVAAVAAVWQAMHSAGLCQTSFTDWGVLAAPRFLGRTAMGDAVRRFAAEGAWGISPHLIPHRSLHSISGTISQALGIHGPNFGIGGGTAAAGELFLSVSTLLQRERLPGLWLVMTGWDPEPTPAPVASPPTCGAVALALCAEEATLPASDWRLHIQPPGWGDTAETGGALSLEALCTALTGSVTRSNWGLPGGGQLVLELRRGRAAASGMTVTSAGAERRHGGEAVSETEVWITGVGTATPLGNSYAEVADRLLAGRSGVRQVRGFDVSEHPSQIAGQIDQVLCPPGFDANKFSSLDRLEQLCLWCCTAALRDAGWWQRRDQLRIGLVLGVGAELLLAWEADFLRGGTRLEKPEQDSEGLIHTLRRRLELSGPAASVSAACASGNYALAQARRWLELGWVDICLAGACDMAVSPMSLAGFGNLRALSRRNGEPQAASRPFDRNRDGFVMSEGGAVFVLERAEAAQRRSARVYGQVAGFGAGSDAHNMVIPSPDPAPAISRHAPRPGGCGRDAGRGGLHQRPCDEHAGRRRGGGAGTGSRSRRWRC